MANVFSLTFPDLDGRARTITLDRPRFSIGRGDDNDLVIAVAGLSRRHALLQLADGRLYLSDNNSSNGTTLNGQRVGSAAVEVFDGDLIVLGNICELTVRAGGAKGLPSPEEAKTPQAAAPRTPDAAPAVPATSGAKSPLLGPHVLLGGIVGFVLLAAVVLLALSLAGDSREPAREESSVEEAGREHDSGAAGSVNARTSGASLEKEPAATIHAPATPTGEPAKGPMATGVETKSADASTNAAAVTGSAAAGSAGGAPDREAVRRVMSRLSTDDSPYISEEGVRDVAEKVREYRGSTALAERIRAMSRGCAEVSALARANNLKPTLLTYAALAQAESGDPVEAARRMAPKLLVLRATFGTETANSSLLLVAAYPYPFDPPAGARSHTPHPLASKLVALGGRNSVVGTSVARTVWFLREKKALTPEAYDLVVRLLAVGVIAQQPRQYGLDAPPVWC